MIFFTSDLHFLHKNIIKYNRSSYVENVDEMNELIINTINAKVGAQDTLFILGDLILGKIAKGIELLKRINCKNIHIVPGNHDDSRLLRKLEELNIATVHSALYETTLFNKRVVMCHYPMVSWNRMHHGAWHLFGHTHGSYEGLGRSVDVGWDSYYNIFGKPGVWSFTELEEYMNKQEFESLCHHSETSPR
jgi:calcineurin-like phosphoesterase family protein